MKTCSPLNGLRATVLLIFGIAVPAVAQNSSQDGGAAIERFTGGLEEVVVTAQRRQQSLQDVPVSVSVASGEFMQKSAIHTIQDLTSRLPNVHIVEGPASDLLNIRGIGSGLNTGFEQSVATFVDGVYRGRGRAIRAALFDLDRVEVLKGPQTTFFGNNAIAGALNIATRKPSAEFDYNMSALYAPEDGAYNLEGGVTTPVSDVLSFRVAGRFSGMDGFVHNDLLDRDASDLKERIGRIAVHFEPNDAFRSDLRIDAGDTESIGAFPWEIVNCPPAPAYGAAAGPCAAYLAQSGGVVDDKLNHRAALLDTFFKYEFVETAWTNAIDINQHTLTSITSYFSHDSDQLLQLVPAPVLFVNGDGLMPTAQSERYRQFAQELRLESDTGGAFEYMVGAYYARGRLNAPLQIALNVIPFQFIPLTAPYYTPGTAVGAAVDFRQEDETASLFASGTVRPTDDVRINLGLRYSRVSKEAHRVSNLGTIGPVQHSASFTPFSPPIEQLFQIIAGSNLNEFADTDRTDSKWQPSVGVQYDLTPDTMAYASYTKGFKAGGFAATSQGEVFDPESVDSYEVGIKSALLDNRMRVNLAAFHMDYSDLQESTFVFLPSGTILSVIGNAAEARSRGVELNTAFQASQNLTLTADIAYLDAVYSNYEVGACTVLQTAIRGQGCVQDLTGKRRPFAPEWSGSFGATLAINMGAMELTLEPLVYFTSDFFQSASADELLSQDGNAKIDLRVAIAPVGGNWELAVIGKNLTDRTTATFRNPVSQSPGTYAAQAERPRSVAVQFSMSY